MSMEAVNTRGTVGSSYLLFFLFIVLNLCGCPVNAADGGKCTRRCRDCVNRKEKCAWLDSYGFTTIQGVYVIAAIGVFYLIVFFIILTLTCCLCNGRRKGRVCPISQHDSIKKKRRDEYVEVNVDLTNATKKKSASNLKPPPEDHLSSKVSEDTVDLDSYANPAYLSEKSVESKRTSNYSSDDSSSANSGNSRKKLVKIVSSATVITNPDPEMIDDNESESEEDDSVTEI